jgi:hypothetical protein
MSEANEVLPVGRLSPSPGLYVDRTENSVDIKSIWAGMRTTAVELGYRGNLMAEDSGVLESKNVTDVARENEPSPVLVNDDDQVRARFNAHPLTDIGKISTTNKLKAIRALMGGWISDDDITPSPGFAAA